MRGGGGGGGGGGWGGASKAPPSINPESIDAIDMKLGV